MSFGQADDFFEWQREQISIADVPNSVFEKIDDAEEEFRNTTDIRKGPLGSHGSGSAKTEA